MISSMGFSSTQISPFRPVCPSYFKLPRSCPTYVSQSLSSPVGLHRFWGKLPSRVIINLQSREEKMILINRNYTAHPGLDVCKDSVTGIPKSWKEETERLLADKRRYNVTASWKAKTERLLAEQRENSNIKNEHLEDGNSYSIMHKRIYPNYPWAQINSKEQTPFGKDGAYFVKNKDRSLHSLYHNEQKTNGNSNVTAGKMDGWAVDHKRENGWFVRNQAADQIMPKGLSLKNVSRDGSQTDKLKSNGYVAVDDVNGRVVDDKRLNGLSMKNVSKEVHRQHANRSIANKTMEKRKNVDTDTRLSDSDETNEKPDVTDNKSNINDRVTLRQPEMRERLSSIYKNVLIVNNVTLAEGVVHKLTNQYKDHVHACDTEVAKIDVKRETPIDHGEIICFSIYSGPNADFGNGKSCIWVDVLDGGGKDILKKFEPFFKDPSIKKVWHNYSFDNHVIENYGIPLSGFHADTMHMARLWDSSRRTEGGYSLEALTGEKEIMDRVKSCYDQLIGKISMKTIFGKKKVKKDGSEGKLTTIAPVEELQREDREAWISYSALDAISTLQLYESLKGLLSQMKWKLDGKLVDGKNMFHFYEEYWQPFGELLVKMETEGMLVDRAYLAEIEKVAKAEQNIAVNRFRNWASKYSSDAKDMNVGSDTQLRQLLFGGTANSKDPTVTLPESREFKVPNVDKVIEEGKKTATKYRNITLHSIGVELQTEMYTATGWPSVSGDALKTLAGKVSAEYDFVNDDVADDVIMNDPEVMIDNVPETKESSVVEDVDISAYGTALRDFQKVGKKEEGIEACHAIAALCEVCSIDSLISNFILPLQGSNVSGKTGRVHCSLNINTETGRLSARRPNLQNQPALEKDRYKIRQAFIASPGNSLIVADYGQLELRILAHLANCKSMLNAFKAGGDFHSRTAMNMYPHIREAIEQKQVLLEWFPTPGEDKPPVPLLKDAFASERRKAKMLNFSIAYGKTPMGLAHDWKVSVEEARKTVELWYGDRQEVLRWQEARKQEANAIGRVYTLLGRARRFPQTKHMSRAQKGHIERAAINTPVQGSAADVAMCAMLTISKNTQLKELGWKLLLQVHDEVILEGPTETAEIAKAIVVQCMSKPFNYGENILKVDLSVDAKCAQNWYAAK